LPPELYILSEVAVTLWTYESGNASMIQVRASKNGVSTLINVNVEQTPEFFNDREDVIVDGIKKRIFHIVRPHERQLVDKTALVHLHFRGLRKFIWNGYEIEISVPGRDHLDVTQEWNLTARDEANEKDGADMGEVAAWLVANQRAGRGGIDNYANLLPLKDFREERP
jgi:hypothetical protein